MPESLNIAASNISVSGSIEENNLSLHVDFYPTNESIAPENMVMTGVEIDLTTIVSNSSPAARVQLLDALAANYPGQYE